MVQRIACYQWKSWIDETELESAQLIEGMNNQLNSLKSKLSTCYEAQY